MAARNQSNSEKTVKSTLRVMPADTWTIDNVTLVCSYRDQIVLPEGFILDDYRDYFEQFLQEVDVPEEFFYSPTRFAESVYGTPDLDFLVLYFSGIMTAFEFNKPRIRILPATSLRDINRLIVEKRGEVRSSRQNPREYTELQEIEVPTRGFI
jgi:hypothetical protein